MTTTAPPPPLPNAVATGADNRPLQHLCDEALESRLAALAGHLAATQAEFLAHVLEMDMRGLWADQGAKCAAAWLSWRLGLSPGTARGYLRVGYALLDLPALAAAFAEGRLSYCKVRAVTRVATPATEAELLEIALGATGAQLERTVRSWRTALTVEQSAAAVVRRRYRRRVEADGSIAYILHVPPDEAPVLDKAIDAALRVVLDEQGEPIEVPEETALAGELTPDPPIVRATADAFLLIAESFLATGPVGNRGDGLEVLLHADLAELEAHLTQQDEPAVDPFAEASAEAAPAEAAPAVVADAAAAAVTDPPSVTARPPTGIRAAGGQPLLPQTALRRLCEASARLMAHVPDGRPIDLGRTVRDATPRQRRVLHERDQHCRFPGCTQRHRLIPHHVRWWTRGGRTDLDNLVLLCPAHHRAVHEVGYQVIPHGAGRFSFRTPTGRRLEPTGQIVDPVTDGSAADDTVRTVVAQLHTPCRPMPTWGGQRLDLRLLIDALVANTLITAGHSLPETPVDQIPRLLREATGWPHTPGWPREEAAPAA